jgi:glycosyltransferase involved in cell wall biosynthesis
MRILMMSRINGYGPISKIHREVGKRSSHTVHGFTKGNSEFEMGDIITHEVGETFTDTVKSYTWRFFSGFDIVHTGPYFKAMSYLPLQKLPVSGNVVHTVHNVEEAYSSVSSKFRFRRKALSTYSNEVTAPSKYISEHVLKTYGSQPTVVPNGVDTKLYHPNRRETLKRELLYVGRFVPRKNPDFIIKLAENNPEWKFKMRGGQNEMKIKNKAQEIENVELLPRLSEQELANKMSSASALLAPFEFEGFGMVIVEALASGTPVIGLNHGNIPYLISDPNIGTIINALDIDEWSNAIKQLGLKTREKKIRKTGENYNWSNITKSYDSIYERSCVAHC